MLGFIDDNRLKVNLLKCWMGLPFRNSNLLPPNLSLDATEDVADFASEVYPIQWISQSPISSNIGL